MPSGLHDLSLPETTRASEHQTLLAVIYLRVSTEDQANRGYSLQNQREVCLERARTLATARERQTGQRVELQTVIFTDAVSGELLERPELENVRAFVKEHRPAYFICLDPDRFSRATYHAIMVANEIEAAGTKLEFVNHDYQSTPEGRLFFTLRVAIAEYEKAKILERTASGRRRKIKEGGLPTGLFIYGYRYDRETEEVSLDPVESAWVRQIFTWAAEPVGCQTIATRLNDAGVRTKRGTRWYRGTVSKMLSQRAYIGEFVVNRLDAKGLGAQRNLPAARRSRPLTAKTRPAEEWVTIPIPAIIPQDLWDQVQAQRVDGRPRRASQGVYLLSGLLTCGYCNGPVYYRPHKSLGHVLVCANRYPYMRDLKNPLPPCRSLPHQAAGPIENQVWTLVQTWLTKPVHLLAYLQQRKQGQAAADVLEALEREKALLEQQLEEKRLEQSRILAVVRTGALDAESAAAELRPLGQQIGHLRETLAQLHDRVAAVHLAAKSHEQSMDRLQTLQQDLATQGNATKSSLDALDLGRKQTPVRMLVERVVVYPRGLCDVHPLP